MPSLIVSDEIRRTLSNLVGAEVTVLAGRLDIHIDRSVAVVTDALQDLGTADSNRGGEPQGVSPKTPQTMVVATPAQKAFMRSSPQVGA